ncbi:MAG: glycosyltransferase family 4 protein [Candidatus Aenigmarchaeota archaeon]|nr:glycosyltransferase family 4 protein [Candidatus Aenigmarchaeota archaeon]
MKILHVVQHFYPCSGGVEVYLYELCRELIRRGHKSDVVCFNTCVYEYTKLPAFEEHEGIRIYRVPYINMKYYKMAFSILKYLSGYDVVHIHTLGFFSDLLVMTKPLHGKPLVLSTHGAMFHTKKFSFGKNIYFYGWDRLVLKGIDETIAVSKNDVELFSGITSNITFIPNGLDIGAYSGLERKPEKGMLLYVGRIAGNKRVDNLIRAVASLKGRMPVKLYIAGDDWMGLRTGLERLARDLGVSGNVVFAGRVSDREKLRLLARAQFFVSASEYEGFGISILEAMAAGVPVIANDIDSFRNFIRHGVNGFLVDFNKPEEVVQLILNIEDKALKMPKEAKKTASGYDWGKVIKMVERVYEQVTRRT